MKAKPVSKTSLTRRQKDKQNAKHSVYLAGLLDQISDALISTDMDFRVGMEYSRGEYLWAENIYGRKAAEVLGHTSGEFIQTEYWILT
jgi:hypothetical protein